MAKIFATGSLLDVTPTTQGRVVLRLISRIHKDLISHFVRFRHTLEEWLKQKLWVFGMDAGTHLRTGVVSLLRPKEANSRLGELSWVWFQRKCKQHNSNIIMLYLRGWPQKEWLNIEHSEPRNITTLSHLLVQSTGSELVSGYHIQAGQTQRCLPWSDEWGRKAPQSLVILKN